LSGDIIEEKPFVLFAKEAPIYVSPSLQSTFATSWIKTVLAGNTRRQILSLISEPEKKLSIAKIADGIDKDSAVVSSEVHNHLVKRDFILIEKATREDKGAGTGKRVNIIPKIYFFDVEDLDEKEVSRRISVITKSDMEAKKKIEKCIEKEALTIDQIEKQTKLPAYLVEAILTILDYKKEVEKVSSFRLVKKS